MKYLVVNADDFGLSAGINRGILEAHRQGIVTSTTVMVNFPDAAAAIAQAQVEAPDLGLGLHLNLTAGRPILPPERVPSLVTAAGTFHPPEAWGGVMAQFAPDEVEAELRAQFERFVGLAGHAPDHLDAHHHAAYLHPAALDALLTLAAEHSLPLRDGGFGLDAGHALALMAGILPGLTTEGYASLMDDLRAVLRASPAPHIPVRLEMGFFGERATLGDLLVILTTLPDESATELMCHPGYLDGSQPATTYTHREDELAYLTSRATRELVQAEGIQLVTFADLT